MAGLTLILRFCVGLGFGCGPGQTGDEACYRLRLRLGLMPGNAEAEAWASLRLRIGLRPRARLVSLGLR